MGMRSSVKLFAALSALFAVSFALKRAVVVPSARLAGAQYPDWAHSHWVWPGGNLKNQADVLQYAHDYVSRGLPMGNLNVDSGYVLVFL